MKYRVVMTHTAMKEVEETYEWLEQRSLLFAARWYHQLLKTLETLAEEPIQWPIAPEGETFSLPIRQRLAGKRQHTYRILFLVHRRSVFVLHIIHGARRFLDFDQLRDSLPPNSFEDSV